MTRYPTRAQVRAAVDRGAVIGLTGTRTVTPLGAERITDAIVALFDTDPEARAAVEAAEADAWDSRGEVPPGISFGEYTDRMGRLTGPHERDDRWLRFGRGGVR